MAGDLLTPAQYRLGFIILLTSNSILLVGWAAWKILFKIRGYKKAMQDIEMSRGRGRAPQMI